MIETGSGVVGHSACSEGHCKVRCKGPAIGWGDEVEPSLQPPTGAEGEMQSTLLKNKHLLSAIFTLCPEKSYN